MVAIIKGSSNIAKTVCYNEHKCRQGVARLLHASGFLKDGDDMNLYEKINRFHQLNALNQRTRINTLHVSLNFDPSEKLSDDILREIATSYMHQIGFGNQPYLVYRHEDAAHPHIHMVSTTINREGKSISLHNIGKARSEPARKQIEKQFNLVRAQRLLTKEQFVKSIDVTKIIYGKSAFKRSISNVVQHVLQHYRCTTIGELNAVLRLYNVEAEKGEKHSRVYRNRGLIYRVLDEGGKAVGPPIKASLLHQSPTLDHLETRFANNKMQREKFRHLIINAVDNASTQGKNLEAFLVLMRKQKMDVMLRTTAEGKWYGITYIDHGSGAVFNGSALGKSYSAAAIEKRLVSREKQQSVTTPGTPDNVQAIHRSNTSNTMEELLAPVQGWSQVPWQFRKKKKRKRKLS